MTEKADTQFYLQDPRLAGLALSPAPVWLWNIEANRQLWTNPVAAALTPSAEARTQIARFAAALPQGGTPRLVRLRGLGPGIGRALLCSCARIDLTDGTSGLLVAAMEPAGPALSLAERVRRLYAQ